MATSRFDEASAERAAPLSRQVRVTVPAKVAYDFDAFLKVQKSILDRLGCPACCSDFDIRWDIEREFRVNLKGQIQEF